MKLDSPTWEEFAVSSIFEIRNGRGITAEEIAENPGTLKAVQSGEENNGVMGAISAGYCAEMNYVYSESMCLTVARTGTAGFVSFQPDGCVVGDSAKLLLLKHEEPTVAVLLFLQVVLQQLRFKYSYGRKVTELKYSSEAIDLPIQRNADGAPVIDGTHQFHPEGYVPDWQFMENYIRSLNHQPITTVNSVDAVSPLVVLTWEEFAVSSIFEIRNGRGITAEEIAENPGTLKAVQSGEENNGVMGAISAGYCAEMNYVYSESMCLTVARTGTAGFVSFQPDGCVVGDSAKLLLLKHEEPTVAVLLFLQVVLQQLRFKYSYGRKVTELKYSSEAIDLPIQRNADGAPVIDGTHQFHPEGYVPDWQFMENYIRSLPYGDRIPEVGEC